MQISGSSGMSSYTQAMSGGGARQRPSKEEMFAKTDADGSGGISIDEIKKMRSEMASKAPEGAPKPPELSDEELAEKFGQADTDGDGELSAEEMDAFMQAMRPQGGRRPPEGGGFSGSTATGLDYGSLLEALGGSSEEASASSDLVSYLTSLIQKTYGITAQAQTTAAETVAETA